MDPFASRRVTIGTTSYATFEDGAELPAIEGWEQSEFDMFQRFSAVGPLYVRSGMGKSTRVLDLLNLRDSVVPGAVALEGFAAAAVDGGQVWLYGRDGEGGARLYAVDADAVAAMEFSTDELPMPSKPYDSQDVVVADGGTLWVARFAIGRVLISTRTGAGAQAHTLAGDVTVAEELFEPVEMSGARPRNNGFLPPEPLVAFSMSPGRVFVGRQFGEPKAVILSLCE